MDINEQKQQFSFAYVRAVASTAGFVVTRPDTDDDSIDLCIGRRGGAGTVRSPRMEIQVKASSRDLVSEGDVHFPLPQKNYLELISDNYLVPRILVIVLVPENISDWLLQSEEQLALRKCGYWYSLLGLPDNNNKESTTVVIPCDNVFFVQALTTLMDKIGAGAKP